MMGIFDGLPDWGQPNPGQYGPPAPGSLNNPLKPPGFDLGQPNPGEYGPPAPGSQNNPPSLWDKLMSAVGGLGTQPGAAPGPTTGMPSGSGAMGPPPMPMLPQYQMAPPRGIGPIFPAAPAAGNSGLMAQYMALQQLMRGG